jgi:hypothetical protein
MFKPTALLTIFLAALLGACGGDGSGSVVGDSATDTTSDEDTSVDTGTDSVSTDTTVSNPQIGTGTGASYLDGQLNISTATLSAGGSTQITATIVDAGNNNAKIVTDEYYVVFSSDCASQSPALSEFSKSDATVTNGSVSVTYNAKGCVGTDLVTISIYSSSSGVASLDQVLSIATGTVDVAQAEIGAITYVGADTNLISIATIGNAVLPKLATVTFKVLDKSNNPVANQEVDFALTNSSGGIELALDQTVTDENGEVSAVVLAGTTHAITSVRATTLSTDNSVSIFTTSQQISVTTGIADQDSFSIALDKFSTWGWKHFGDGTEINVTAFANDHFQNPVPDGTIVNFIADAGSIESSCVTVGGSCSVVWISAAPLPGSDEAGRLYTSDAVRDKDSSVEFNAAWNGGLPGVASVVAYTVGEAGFSDANGNDLYDAGESFVSLSETFLDANENGIYDYNSDTNPREDLVDFNGDGTFTSAPTTYQGITCADSTTHCQSLVHVRDKARFIVASAATSVLLESVVGSVAGDVTSDSCVILADGEQLTFNYKVNDINGNIPPAGTQFTFGADGLVTVGTIDYEIGTGDFSTTALQYSFVVKGGDAVLAYPASPVFAVTQVDGVEASYSTVAKYTDSLQVTAEVDQLPVTPSRTLNITFTDACGNVVTDNIDVIAELTNGQFTGPVLVNSYSTTTGSIALDIETDGVSSYLDGGLSLTVFRAGVSDSVLVSFGVLD